MWSVMFYSVSANFRFTGRSLAKGLVTILKEENVENVLLTVTHSGEDGNGRGQLFV